MIGRDRLRILLTIVTPKPTPEGELAREAVRKAYLPLFWGEIRRPMAFQRAALEGVTVEEVSDGRALFGWQDYQRIGKTITRLNG